MAKFGRFPGAEGANTEEFSAKGKYQRVHALADRGFPPNFQGDSLQTAYKPDCCLTGTAATAARAAAFFPQSSFNSAAWHKQFPDYGQSNFQKESPMAPMERKTAPIDPSVLDLIRSERQKALSPREWQFRLRGYGYAVKTVGGAQILTRLTTGDEVGKLPPEFA
ncbi:hypothetical protein [Leisingera sp. ANG-S5]|uniref:hypothetical protein n=2 Tax=Leisingera TaxID=191028 RepID=UPI003159BB9B